MPRISQRFVLALTPVQKDSWFWDDLLKGFAVRLRPGGEPSYYVRYLVKGRKRKRLLGSCHVLKSETAREEARRILELARLGTDIIDQEREDRGAPTVLDLMERHLKEHVPPKIAPETWEKNRSNWKLYIIPHIGKIKVKELEWPEIEKIKLSLIDRPSSANHVLSTLSKALNDCEKYRPAWRPVMSNPCHLVSRLHEEPRDILLSEDQTYELLEVLRQEKEVSVVARLIFFLILTGLRRGEWSKRTWDQFDEEKGTLYIPRAKDGRPRTVTLPNIILEELRSMPRSSPYIFPSSTGKTYLRNPRREWIRISKKAGIIGVRIHDLRHTVGSAAMNEGGLSLKEVSKAILGHRKVQTTERYLGVHPEKLRRISDRAAGSILRSGPSSRPREELPD